MSTDRLLLTGHFQKEIKLNTITKSSLIRHSRMPYVGLLDITFYYRRQDSGHLGVTFSLCFQNEVSRENIHMETCSRPKGFLIFSGQSPMYRVSNYSTVGLACGSSPFNDIVSTRNKVHQNPSMLLLFVSLEQCYSGIPISPTLSFSNLPITRTKTRFPPRSRTLQFYPRFLELLDFSHQFSFPLEVQKPGIPLGCNSRRLC